VTPADSDNALREAKLEALAEFAAGAGHEINNPLATILGRAELLLKRIDRLAPSGETAEAARDLHIIAGQAQRIRDMIGDLMLFARPPAPRLEACDLTDGIRTTLKGLAEEAAEQGVELHDDLTPGIIVRADRIQLAVVLAELLRNALNATPGGGVINIATRIQGAGDLRMATLTIEDTGSGLSETDRLHLFDPFYSGRQAGRGLGFGLCKCWRIVHLHGGTIDVAPREAGGVRATIEWPAPVRP